MFTLSVIVCTYNPDSFIFENCLNAIKAATKNYQPLEIIIIDNNSAIPLQNQDYIQRFIQDIPSLRIINEPKQGLTPARIRGIKEATGNLLLFIDDDNFIKDNFFEKGVKIAADYPHIGAWSGQVKLKFENTPAAWTKKYWGLLVYREFSGSKWSNFPHMPETMPCGAGLFVRRNVADHYLELHHSGKRNIQLDRSGSSLLSAGDNDLAACACDIGLGVGLFEDLSLDHYIPSNRLSKEYLIKLAEGISLSTVVFKSFRGEYPTVPTQKNTIANYLRALMMPSLERSFFKAVLNGEKTGRKLVEKSGL
jgi:glycosyltransferase involved in cell wall biosynthesis